MNATDIDFAAILAQAIADYVGESRTPEWYAPHAEAQLAAKVPALCPDCKGQGRRSGSCDHCNDRRTVDIGQGGSLAPCPICCTPQGEAAFCAHPNAPTIGQILDAFVPIAILARCAQHRVTCAAIDVGFPCTCGLAEARAAVVALQP